MANFFDWDDEESEAPGAQEPSAPVAAPAAPPPSEEAEPTTMPQEEPSQEETPPTGDEDDNQDEYQGEQDTRDVQAANQRIQASHNQQREQKRVGAIAARELAWGRAVQALDGIPWKSDMLDKVRDAARSKQIPPMGLAEDLRMLAGNFPQYAENLHSAADKLVTAAKQEAEVGPIPANALPMSQQEAQPKFDSKAAEISAKQKELQTAGLFRSPQLQKELAQLRTEQGALAATIQPQPGGDQEAQAPSVQGDLSKHLEAMPGGYPGFLQATQEVAAQLQKAGINVTSQNLLDKVPLATAMSMVLKVADPKDTSGWRKFLTEMQDPSGRGDLGSSMNAPPRQMDDPALQAIQAKQQKYQQLMNQFGHLHDSQNWLSAIGMFLTAMFVGPKAALMIWGRAGQERSLRMQLQSMHEDIQQSIQMRSQQQNLDYKNRAMAARQQNQSDLEGRRETASLTRLFIGHQLAMQQAKESHGLKDQDAKDLSDEFKRHMQMAGQSLHEGTDPTQFDQNVKNAAMKNYHNHAAQAEAINKLIAVPEGRIKAMQQRKNGTAPANPDVIGNND